MPTRNVLLSDRHEELIGELIESGRYQNASEVMREGLRLVEEREAALEGPVWREFLGSRIEEAERGDAKWVEHKDFKRRARKLFDRVKAE